MNATQYGAIVTGPDADSFLTVRFGDALRRVYAQPERFTSAAVVAAGWPVPAPGDYAAVSTGTPQWQLLWVIKRGAPSYVYEGG